MATYDTMTILKHLNPATIEELFAPVREHVEQPTPEYARSELSSLKDDAEGFTKRWNACLGVDYPDRKSLLHVSKLHDVLQTIHNIRESSCDSGTLAIELAEGGREEIILPDEFADWNRYEQAAYIYLHHKDFWERWSNLVIAQDCSRKKKCIRYPGLPKTKPSQEDADIEAMQDDLVKFFKEEKKCRSCKISDYNRTYDYYYFARLQEKPTVLEVDDPKKDSFEPTRVILPFKLIFSYNEEEGVFSIYGDIDAAESKELAEMLVHHLVKYDGQLEREPKATYDLSNLKDRNFAFQTDESDGVEEVMVKSLTIKPLDDPESEMTYRNKSAGAYRVIENFANQRRIHKDSIEVTRATIHFRMSRDFKSFRHVSLELGLSTDDLLTKTERQRELLKKYIARWGFKCEEADDTFTMMEVLTSFSSAEKPTMDQDFRNRLPLYIKCGLAQWNFLKPAKNAKSIAAGGERQEVHLLPDDEGGVIPSIIGQSGTVYQADEYDTQRYMVDFTPLAVLLHEQLECKGQLKAELDNKVWLIGHRGQEARNIYLVRNWHGFQDVQDFLAGVKDNSLVIYLGEKPDFIRIGKSSSENPATASEIQCQYYAVSDIVDYSEKEGFSVDAKPIWENIKTMFARRPAKTHTKGPGSQSKAQEKAEEFVWTKIGKVMLDIAQYAEDGDELNNSQIDCLRLVCRTKSEFCKWAGIKNYELTRVLGAWGDEKENPYGVVYRGLFDILVPPNRVNAGDLVGTRIQQLNDLYHSMPQKIKNLRELR